MFALLEVFDRVVLMMHRNWHTLAAIRSTIVLIEFYQADTIVLVVFHEALRVQHLFKVQFILISDNGTAICTTWLEAALSFILIDQLADCIGVYSVDAEEFIIVLL